MGDEDYDAEEYDLDDDSEEVLCDSLCIGCRFYDDMNDRCRHHACSMEEAE